MKYTYKLTKRIHCTIVVEGEVTRRQGLQQAIEQAKEKEDSEGGDLLNDGDEWEDEKKKDILLILAEEFGSPFDAWHELHKEREDNV